jgi:hypothetical protein
MALFVLTVNNLPTALDKQHQESAIVHRALTLAMQDFRSAGGKKVTGNIVGDGAAILGTWTYTPQATS